MLKTPSVENPSFSRRGSYNGSMDLPVISEPEKISDDDDDDDDGEYAEGEVMRMVQSEVERLVRFNRSAASKRRGTVG